MFNHSTGLALGCNSSPPTPRWRSAASCSSSSTHRRFQTSSSTTIPAEETETWRAEGFFRRAMMSTCLLVGCAADVLQDDHDLHASVESGELPSPRMAEASVRCDGTPLPECDGAFTGARCDLPCSGPAGEVTAAQCGLDVYCHSNGSVYGLATRNAVLYRGAPDDDEPVVESDFEAWIVGHAADVGARSWARAVEPRAASARGLSLGGRTADDLPLLADVRWAAGAGTGWYRDVGVRAAGSNLDVGRDRRQPRHEMPFLPFGERGDPISSQSFGCQSSTLLPSGSRMIRVSEGSAEAIAARL
jgi:hypothetical protein